MSTKRYKPEQVVNILRQIEVELANGKTTPKSNASPPRLPGTGKFSDSTSSPPLELPSSTRSPERW